MRYAMVHVAEDAGSHFEGVLTMGEVRRTRSRTGASVYAKQMPARSAVLRGAVRARTDEPHVVPRGRPVVNLRDPVEAEVSSREIGRFGPGDLAPVEDTHGTGHISRHVGAEERLSMIVRVWAVNDGGKVPCVCLSRNF